MLLLIPFSVSPPIWPPAGCSDTGKNSISLILTAKIYGTGTEISFFDRSKLSISTDQYAILLISVVEACGDGRAGFRPERFSYVPANK